MMTGGPPVSGNLHMGMSQDLFLPYFWEGINIHSPTSILNRTHMEMGGELSIMPFFGGPSIGPSDEFSVKAGVGTRVFHPYPYGKII